MADTISVELIKLVPSLLWSFVALVALFLFQRSIRDDLLPRLSKFKALGVEASFVKQTLDEASKTAPTGDEHSRNAVARRAARLGPILNGARVLLVNDIPDEMKFVIALLRSLNMDVTVATDTDKALNLLRRDSFDVVLSDMTRGGVRDEGIKFLDRSVELGINRPTIFTVAQYDPSRGTPPYAFAITNRVDDMVHYVFDVLERSRG